MHENALKESLQKHACSITGGAQPRWVLHHHVDDIAAQPMQRRILRSFKDKSARQSINQSIYQQSLPSEQSPQP